MHNTIFGVVDILLDFHLARCYDLFESNYANSCFVFLWWVIFLNFVFLDAV